MQFGLNWLNDYLNELPAAKMLEKELPLVGFEVESLASAGQPFSGVVVAEIVKAIQHPNADRLRLCDVTDGEQQYRVVCGAPNARAGIKVALSKVGAVLPGNFKIKRSKIRGEVSEGMLCSGAELEISDESDGIIELSSDAKLGANVRELLNLDEQVIDIDITPNRGDCLNVRGLAREISVMTKSPATSFTDKKTPKAHTNISDEREVSLQSPELCPRYAGRIIKLGEKAVKSPQWLQDRITRAGLRPISLVVDVTNLVMLDLGQPLHAFDNSKLNGTIVVRKAKEKEKLLLINEQEINLSEDKLVIADDTGAIALAGIMGGASTQVDDSSEYIFLEAAHFSINAIAGRARSVGLHTDASMRFERGVDWQLPVQAIEMATQLLIDYAQAEAGPIIDVVSSDHLPKIVSISCDMQRFNQLAGVELEEEQSVASLGSLGFDVVGSGNGKLSVTSPTWRYDIERPEDILEEILRVYGFSNIPDQLPKFTRPVDFGSENSFDNKRFLDHLVGLGYQEVVTYTFIDEKSQNLFLEENHQSIELANPISTDLSHMRYSLTASLLKTFSYNIRRQHKDMRVFEFGLRFQASQDNTIQQVPVLAMAGIGSLGSHSWQEKSKAIDFYAIKSDIESLLSLTIPINSLKFIRHSQKGFHPGQTAQIFVNDRLIGFLGAIHPRCLKSFDLENQQPYVCELDLLAISKYERPTYKPVSMFPGVTRDMSLLVDTSVQWQQIHDTIISQADDTLVSVQPFDLYQHESLGKNTKSIALRLFWQSVEATLTDSCINQKIDVIIKALRVNIKAKLRS